MTTQKELVDLGAKYPNHVKLYAKLMEDRENYLDTLKKLHDNILQVNFMMACAHARHTTLLENIGGMQLILEHDMREAYESEEAPRKIET